MSEVHSTLIHFTPGGRLIHVRGTQHTDVTATETEAEITVQ